MFKSTLPRIDIELRPIDYLVNLIAVASVLALIVVPAWFFGDLPAEIPSHFNAAGEPDAFSSRGSIWVLPVVGVITTVGMLVLSRYPHLYNYPVEITEKNARTQYTLASRMIRIVGTTVAVLFTFISYRTIQTALGQREGLGDGFILIFMLGTFAPTIIYLIVAASRRDS